LLDQATLETVKNKRGIYELLNCDDHRDLCKKKLRRDPNEFRPDILHQELLALLDSPLNKAGLLKVYIHTKSKVLIDVHSSIRIPRTYKRFAGLMVQLLHKMKIKAGNDGTTLLKVIKNPFSQHLPPSTRCFGFSCEGTLYSPIALAKTIVGDDPATSANQPPTCLVVGAMSTGHITIEDHPYIEKMLSISNFPLSGASALSRVMGGIEHHWGIV
jgi:rRNA small subunit pseudouridine methyltransferase Nep1